jgi:hypothetical protein
MPLLEICRIDRSNDSIEYGSILLNQLYTDSILSFKLKNGEAYSGTKVSFSFGDEYLTINNIRKSEFSQAVPCHMGYYRRIAPRVKNSNLVIIAKDICIFCELSFSQLQTLEDIALNAVCGGVMLRWD